MPDITSQSSTNAADSMFSLNIPKAGEEPSVDSIAVSPPLAPVGEDEISVYTMPKEFVGAKGKKRKTDSEAAEGDIRPKGAPSNSRTKLIIGVVILVLLMSAGGLAGYFLLKERRADISPLSPQPPSSPPVVEELEIEPPSNEEPPVVEEPQGEEVQPPQDLSTILSGDLIQKPVVSYNDRGMKTTEAVLSLEKEQNVNYALITINEHIVSEKPEYFAYVAGQPYEIQLRGETPKSRGVLTITYSEELLSTLDIIPADLRIGYLPFSRLKETLYRQRGESSNAVVVSDDDDGLLNELTVQEDEDGESNEEMIDDSISEEEEIDAVPEEQDGSAEDIGGEEASGAASVLVWDILKAQDLDDDIRSISSVLEEVHDGIYAIVPQNVDNLIDLPEEPEETPPSPISEEIVPAADLDGDDLSDREELLYGTSPLSPDSDGDGYTDGLEVVNLYSPARGNSLRLKEDSQFLQYSNIALGYSFLKPAQFTLAELSQNKPGDVIMTSSEKEAIVMGVQENPNEMTLSEWLVSISPAISVADFESFTTSGGLLALAAPQKTTYYIALPASRAVLVLSYTSPREYSYTTTVRMIVESVSVNDQ